ncbi:lipoyl(octanoyl) transferase LipB [Maridesulfovibrio salexigens]|uniref:Octanoyltransferase n=1 Tax=Maridesulfovibrio salexigens (strain ATCC 14822 / DSM 2638 / NCIMB 8403 / VKM B-1763) TaxID=526222 RepID=LIPB_MARSD|nr:lipoyl(octanoyl) transferase LipB [Maridesulfovibrio salexigens]C6BZY6.1 RecName: Full=Octanoyltransferase; AltName: Full=Lipoate-protein ligase B; AltName: Full=Lipoyl/octanoyl transferase; AltName: Full=Octanoyl-[acyl-carrier-protein]-protein N-octanoyltransferase [Maridesulfovibrio salexigens DSM 2638]ACS80857.1 lipoate-protein ligase B [Maridesulfovibrio salexigens DSM 2638]
MEFIDLGLIPHGEAERIQLERLKQVMEGTAEDALYLLEHPPVVTLGRQGGLENLLISEEALKAMGAEVVQTARGGNITCHYPGQMVVYPVMRIEKRRGGIKKFFFDMEETAIRTAARFGVQAARSEGRPGVWVGPGKLCSIGIGVKKWITYHGLSFNVSSDMKLFDAITLCGLHGAHPTSLSREAGKEISTEEVKNVFREEFGKVFTDTAVAAS